MTIPITLDVDSDAAEYINKILLDRRDAYAWIAAQGTAEV